MQFGSAEMLHSTRSVKQLEKYHRSRVTIRINALRNDVAFVSAVICLSGLVVKCRQAIPIFQVCIDSEIRRSVSYGYPVRWLRVSTGHMKYLGFYFHVLLL